MKEQIKEMTWSCAAEFSVFGTRKELDAQLRLEEGELIREVMVSCAVADEYEERSTTYIICGDSLDSIKEKALKLFCAMNQTLLCSVPHGDIVIDTLVEVDEDYFDIDFSFLESWNV